MWGAAPRDSRIRLLLGVLAATALSCLFGVLTSGAVGATGQPSAVDAPLVTGNAEQGSLLTTSNGTWSGNTPMTFAYQWQLCNYLGGKCRDILNATSNTYKPVSSDVNMRLRVVVTASNASGSTSQASLPTDAVRADSTAPSAPGNLRIASAGQTSLSLAWSASTDGVGVAGYGVYRDGSPLAITQLTGYTIAGLSCGKSYTVAVDAYDAVGNRSAKASLIASTAGCGTITDTQAPSTPTGLTKAAATATSISVSWTASTDNIGVTGYGKYRNGSLVATSTGTTYTFSGLSCGTGYTLAVDARDAAGNRSGKTYLSAATAACGLDTTAPAISLTAPAPGAIVTGTIPMNANAIDNVGVAGVQFKVDGVNVSSEDTSSPYGVLWNTASVGNGNHTLTAVARDAGGNISTSAQVVVSVSNVGPIASPSGLMAAYSFDAGAGSTVADVSGHNNTGTISNATWAAAGKYGSAMSFNGANAWVTIPDSSSLDFTNGMTLEAWVKPTELGGSWRAVLVKEQPGFLNYALYAHDGGPGPSGHVFVGGEDRYFSGSVVPTNTWTHLAATYDGTAVRLYVNGAVATTLPVSGSISPSSDPLRIGGDSVWPEWFSGLIDEVRAYNRALSPAEIQVDMGQPLGGTTATGPSTTTDTSAPTAPTGLVPTTTAQTSITLNWTASTDNVGVTGYGSYKSGSLAGTSANTGYTFSGLTCGTTYTLQVDAYDAAGNRSAKAGLTVPTSACTTDTTPPSIPTNLVQTGASETAASISWSPSTDNVGVVGYRIYKDDLLVATIAQTSYTYTGLTCGTPYTMAVEAVDAAGNVSNRYFAEVLAATSACSTLDSIGPTAPTALVTSAVGQTSIALSWAASSDNVGVSGYGRFLNGGFVSNGTVTSYTFTGLACGTTYALSVDAYDAAGNRSPQASVNATTSPCSGGDLTPPTVPTGLATSGIGQTSITLNWTGSTDNVGVAGYGRYRDGAMLSSGSGTSFTFSGLSCGKSYTLGVDAFDAAGNRSGQAQVTAATTACTTSSGSIFLSPSGSDSASCSLNAPCKTLDRGYHVAQPGQTVELAGGDYGSQTINPDSTKNSASSDVVIRPASGATVTMDMVKVYGSHIVLHGTWSAGVGSTSNWRIRHISNDDSGGAASTSAHYVTWEGIDARSFWIGHDLVDHITIRDVDFGPSYICDPGDPNEGLYTNRIGGGTNILIDHVIIHDQNSASMSSCHTGGLQFVTGTGPFTIRNSIFRMNAVYDINIGDSGTNNPRNVTIENNWFGAPIYDLSNQTDNHQAELQFSGRGGTWENYLVRFNSLHNGIMMNGEFPDAHHGTRIIGNVAGGNPNCSTPGVTFAYNLWVGSPCSSTDRTAPSLPFVNNTLGSEDFHLIGGTAVDMVTPVTTDYLDNTDIDGDSRPRGAARDAGADER